MQQADCEKIMHEVWVFRGQRGPPVYVPKLCTGPHIGTTTNVVLIYSSSMINLQYIISCSLTLRQVITTVHPILIKPLNTIPQRSKASRCRVRENSKAPTVPSSIITQHLLSSKFGSFRKWQSCRLGRKVYSALPSNWKRDLQTENETFKQNQSFQRWQHESGKNSTCLHQN